MTIIKKIHARQILDSRGNPTIEVDIAFDDIVARASVPSGASCGRREACELRDVKNTSYYGKGVLGAVHNVNTVIADSIIGLEFKSQREFDNHLIALDGTEQKQNLGANAILACSIAFAKYCALKNKIPLFKYFGDILGNSDFLCPVPMINVINGGAHSNNNLSIQEFMIMVQKVSSFSQALQNSCEVFYTLRDLINKRGMSTNTGDEGGFAPSDLRSSAEALDLILEAVSRAGFAPGEDFAITLDAAADHFYDGKKYALEGLEMDSEGLCYFYENLAQEYPIISIEDPFSEDDTPAWQDFTLQMHDKLQIVGDDLFVTNSNLLSNGIKDGLANAILIKPNQIGSITETIDTMQMAQKNNYATVVSHRSGETEDITISHLAVGTRALQIKTGSLSRTDRVCKYNELLRIQEQLQLYK